MEEIFITYTLEHNLKGFYEVMPNRFNGKFTSVDNILIKSTFDIINIDYTTSIRKRVIINKCRKEYQNYNKKLIIVALKSNKIEDFLSNKNIPFKENIKILTANEFASFIGYYGDYLENYKNAIKILNIAYKDDGFLIKLEQLAKNARKNLEHLNKKYPISQEDYDLESSWWLNY